VLARVYFLQALFVVLFTPLTRLYRQVYLGFIFLYGIGYLCMFNNLGFCFIGVNNFARV
jgi:hypothetical protein